MMDFSKLSPAARQVLTQMANGRAVHHLQFGFRRGALVKKSGRLLLEDGNYLGVTAAVMAEIEASEAPLETYQHNIAVGWKTVVVYSQREMVAKRLMEPWKTA